MALTLIIGGARSGKSALALRLAAASGRPVRFIATMIPGDDELRERVAIHRAERPQYWTTVEEPLQLADALGGAVAGEYTVVDCLTLWVSNCLMRQFADESAIPSGAAAAAVNAILDEAQHMASRAATFDGEVCVVTNEVGAGVVPAYPLGRVFRDALGGVNALFATRASRLFAVTAGHAIDLKALGALPIDAIPEGRGD
jgi:adenosyl cobinamide kinase/adenosyl cobinamide phosphate guanylyltransferase